MLKWRAELASLIENNGSKTGVELGVYMGKSFRVCLKHNKGLRLTGIDSWQTSPGYSSMKLMVYELYCRLIRLRYFTRAKIIKGDVKKCVHMFSDNSLDFVHYDLFNMRISTVEFHENVLALWVPKIRKGGILVGRDLAQPDLTQALENLGIADSLVHIGLNKPSKKLSYIIVK